ncbi:MAG TPA: energy transducer TonB [Thermoanaerobaculia bacterium]
MPIQIEAPEFPDSAVKAQMTGTVDVEVVVSPDGSVTSAEGSPKPNPLLASISKTAARGWRFEPSADRTERRTILHFEFDVRVDEPAGRECYVGPSRVTVVLPDTVRVLGWSRPPPPTTVYGARE